VPITMQKYKKTSQSYAILTENGKKRFIHSYKLQHGDARIGLVRQQHTGRLGTIPGQVLEVCHVEHALGSAGLVHAGVFLDRIRGFGQSAVVKRDKHKSSQEENKLSPRRYPQ